MEQVRRSALWLLGFLVAAAFWAPLLDAVSALRWAALALGVPLCLMAAAPNDRSVLPWWALAWLPAAALTLAWAPDKLGAADELVHLAILAGVFYLGASIDDARPAWLGLALGVAISAPVALAQSLGWEGLRQAVAPAGLFVNKNVLAEAGMVALIAALALRAWWLVPFALVAALLPGSRAVLGALALTLCVWHAPWRRPLAAALALAAAWAFLSGAETALLRLGYWRDALGAATWHGAGLGAYAFDFPSIEHAHSEPVQLVYELGIFAVPLAAVFIYALGVKTRGTETERLVLVAVAAVALLSFPLHMPLTAFAAALAAGRLAGARHRLRGVEPHRAVAHGAGA